MEDFARLNDLGSVCGVVMASTEMGGGDVAREGWIGKVEARGKDAGGVGGCMCLGCLWLRENSGRMRQTVVKMERFEQGFDTTGGLDPGGSKRESGILLWVGEKFEKLGIICESSMV